MQRRTVVFGGACSLALAVMPVFAAGVADPFEWIVSLNNSILDEIRADPKLHAGIRRRFRRLWIGVSWRRRTLR